MVLSPVPTPGAVINRDAVSAPSAGLEPHGLDTLLQMSDAEFSRISGHIHRETGIVISPSKRSMLVSRLSRRLRHLGLRDFAAYADLIGRAEGDAERMELVSAITTNVTSFFREPHHFKALADLMPDLAARLQAGGRVRLWSAGCSTGQEPYSLAATILEHMPDAAGRDLRILATDIDPKVITEARRGQYSQRAIGDNPSPLLTRVLRKSDTPGEYVVADTLRALIRFEVLNLLEPWPFQGEFDVIFCRNVVIYFDRDTRIRLWSRFADRIPAGGMLFLGHSERMDTQIDALFTSAGLTQYKRTALPVSASADRAVHNPPTPKDR